MLYFVNIHGIWMETTKADYDKFNGEKVVRSTVWR